MNIRLLKSLSFFLILVFLLSCSPTKKLKGKKSIPSGSKTEIKKESTVKTIEKNSFLEITSHQLPLDVPISFFEPNVKMAKWKDYYLISFFDDNFQSNIFKTRDFEKFEKVASYKKQLIHDMNTDAGQIALLISPMPGEKYPHEIYFKIIDERGIVTKSTKLLGDADMNKYQATELDNYANRHLSWCKDHYAAVFTIQHNWADSLAEADVHQAHTELYISKEGKVLTFDVPWIVSHTFELHSALSENYKLKTAKGDAYPRGLYYEVSSHELEKTEEDPEYPGEIDYFPIFRKESNPMPISGKTGDNNVDLVLADPDIDEKNHLVLISGTSGEKRKSGDIFFIREDFLNKDPKPETIWLTNTPNIEEHSLRMLPFSKDNYLLVWMEYDLNTARSLSKRWMDKFLYEEEIEEAVGIKNLWNEIGNLQKTKAVLMSKEGKFLGSPINLNMNLGVILRDLRDPNDHIYQALREFEMKLSEALLEENRIIMSFYYPKSGEIIFYEIKRPKI
jgi:hypothetical protein